MAVDGILERLVAVKDDVPSGGGKDGGGSGGGGSRRVGPPRVVRLGHPARLMPQVSETAPCNVDAVPRLSGAVNAPHRALLCVQTVS